MNVRIGRHYLNRIAVILDGFQRTISFVEDLFTFLLDKLTISKR